MQDSELELGERFIEEWWQDPDYQSFKVHAHQHFKSFFETGNLDYIYMGMKQLIRYGELPEKVYDNKIKLLVDFLEI